MRIIPARAGSRRIWNPKNALYEDHPRACGEQQYLLTSSVLPFGSSPRVRGAGTWEYAAIYHSRIIPARAGSRRSTSRPSSRAADHPRACGEQASWCAPSLVVPGSSPRVRGAATSPSSGETYPRIIPARAGSSTNSSRGASRSWDHPRACGEQLWNWSALFICEGSSPRVRGAAHQCEGKTPAQRIIPARAGSRD